MKISVSEPELGKEELANVIDCVKSGMISGYGGQYLEEFEDRFSTFCGCAYGVATTSCATAMLLALESLGIGARDEVITSTFTMIATVSAIMHTGATPVLVDVEPDTWNINPTKIEEKITHRTRAIIPVPIYGHPVDILAIREIADLYDLVIIEDAAEAIGARYHNGPVGALSDVACFSFYINKVITTGEGGMLVTNDKELADRARRLKGYDTDARSRFTHQRLGFNYRMSNMQAAIGCAQMDKIGKLVSAKKRIAGQYLSRLGKLDWLQMPTEKNWATNCYWVFGLLVKPKAKMGRDELVKALRESEIETRNFFVPMNLQPALLDKGLFQGEKYPIAEDISRRGLYLPNGVALTEAQIDYICNCIEGNGKCLI